MANDNQLAIRLEARIRDFERNMAKAAKTADGQFGKIEKRAKSAASDVSGTFANFGKGLLAGVAAGGIAGIVKGFGDVARSVSDIGREAKTAGLAAREFQEWRYVAEQARIPLDAMTDAFKELNLRADEFATTGKGSAAEAFQRIGLSQDEVKKRLSDPSALLLEIIDRTKQLGNTAAGVRIFDELLGGQGGEKFVQLIDQGASSIRDTINEAHTLGQVMTDDVIKQAEVLDQRFAQVSSTVGTALKTAIVEAAQALSNFISLFQAFDKRSSDNLQSQRNLLEKEQKAAQKNLGRFGGMFDTPAFDTIEKTGAQIKKIDEELKRRALDKLKIDLEVQKTEIDNPIKPIVPPSTAKTPKKSDEERARDKAAAAALREADQVRELISQLEFERSLIGKSAVEREKMNALRDAGSAATAKQKEQIEQLVEATHKENAAFKETQRQLELVNETGRDVAGGILSGLLDGARGADILADSLRKVSDVLLNEVLDSIFKVNNAGGSGGGLLGSIFGALGGRGGFKVMPGAGLFSEGGYTGQGGKYQPAGIVHKGEYVIPKATVDKMGVGGIQSMLGGYANGGLVGGAIRAPSMPRLQAPANNNSSVLVNYNPQIDNRGASAEAVSRLERAMARDRAEFQSRTIQTIRDANKRNVKLR